MHQLVRVALRLAAVAAFAVSALTGAQAAWSRWEVCFVDGMESDRCQLVQDHRYDYELPAEPWVPIDGAAQLEGVSYLALGLALLAVAAAMGGRWYVRAGAAALGTAWLVMGVPTLRAGLAGTALEPPGAAVVLLMLFFYGGPLLTLALAVESWARDRRQSVLAPQTAMGVLWLLLMAAQPFPEWLLAGGIYASYDTHPGTGLVRSVLVALAAAVLLLAPWRRPRAADKGPVTAPGTSTPGSGTSS